MEDDWQASAEVGGQRVPPDPGEGESPQELQEAHHGHVPGADRGLRPGQRQEAEQVQRDAAHRDRHVRRPHRARLRLRRLGVQPGAEAPYLHHEGNPRRVKGRYFHAHHENQRRLCLER